MLGRPLLVLGLFGLALAAGCVSGGSATGPSGSLPASRSLITRGSASQYIKNVIVIIQENRSFENLFAGYPGANAPTTGCASPTPSPTSTPTSPVRPLRASDRRPASGTGCPPGDQSVTLHAVEFENNPDLRHDWYSSLVDWNNGNMDGFTAFGSIHGADAAYAYVEQTETQPYWTMAQQYVLADNMFPTEFGGSFTGHLMLVAGTDDIELPGHAEVDFPSHRPDDCDSPPGTRSSYVAARPYRKRFYFQGPFPCFDQFNTMAQVLDNAGISWRIYANRVLDGGFWEPFEAVKYVRYGPDWHNDISAPPANVLADIQYGKLASVSWVTPTKNDSDHPAYHSAAGPSWVASIVNAVGASPYWASSAIIVVWDDWGGFYDNAAPPQLDYRGLGIRVPCLIISPYAKQGYVSDVQYEYGSILRFIEEVYGLPAGSIGPVSLGYTDARAASLDDAFNFAQTPRKFTRIRAKYPLSHFLHERPSYGPVDPE